MAYNEHHADRIRRILKDKGVLFEEKKMMGGLCIMVNDKMCCGLVHNKSKEMDLLMARIGPELYEKALNNKGALPMDFTGRPMKGFVFVSPEGIDMDEDLESWIDLCLEYNPRAKSSKKK